jgi:beta-mannosidase
VAAIELNGAPVGFTANAHRPHAFDVTGLLAPGGDGSAANRLAITLFSAPAFAAAQAAAYPYEVPATEVRIWVVHVPLL